MFEKDCFGGSRPYAVNVTATESNSNNNKNEDKTLRYKPHMGERLPTVSPYTPEFTGKVSIFEQQRPNQVTRTVAPFESTIGERPQVSFGIMFDYRDRTPQIDAIIEYCVDLIVGTDLNINTDEEKDPDGKWQDIMIDFKNRINLFDKVKMLTDDALTGGTSIMARVFKAGFLENLEQFDMTTLKRVKRDVFGNVVDYLIDDGNGGEKSVKEVSNVSNINKVFVPLRFRPRGRDFFGRSLFHGLAVERNVGNRTTRPIVEGLWSLDDVVIGTLENFAYPREYHIFDGINPDDLEKEAQKFKESKPGDVMFVNRMHTIDRREPTQAKFDAFFTHMSDIVQLGTGFPLEILLGDFTSRASSQTTDSLLMRRIKAFQQNLINVVKTEILEEFLRSNYPELGDDQINDLNVSVEFETSTPMEYTPDQVLSRYNSKAWTVDELRNYDKKNGMELDDDDIIKQQQEFEQGLQQKQLQDSDEIKQENESLKKVLTLSNQILMKSAQERKNDSKNDRVKESIELERQKQKQATKNELVKFLKTLTA